MLESQFTNIQNDVTEIKSDVKKMMAAQAAVATALAVSKATGEQNAKDRMSTGVWVRSLIPVFLSAAALVLVVIDKLTD